jgi:hypothetical protein
MQGMNIEATKYTSTHANMQLGFILICQRDVVATCHWFMGLFNSLFGQLVSLFPLALFIHVVTPQQEEGLDELESHVTLD